MNHNSSIKNIVSASLGLTEESIKTSFDNIGYSPVFGITTNELSALVPSFIPIANHILSFIKYWTSINSQYFYEVICTKRSWYGQKEITGNDRDDRNGLSWYLYGNAISINVYSISSEPFSSNDDGKNGIKKTINIKDGSSIKFIKDAQSWFNSNLLNGNVLKIFGIFEDTKDASLLAYKDDQYTVYWGGIFDAYTNETHWEWHPGYLPTDLPLVREKYLNNAFLFDSNSKFINSLNDIFDFEDYCVRNTNFVLDTEKFSFLKSIRRNISTANIANYYEGVVKNTYLSTLYEIIVEDYISMYKLKSKINKLKKVDFFNIFKWAKNNPNSLAQTIIYYSLIGDVRTRAFFNKIKETFSLFTFVDDIVYYNNEIFDEDFDSPFIVGTFTLNKDEENNISIETHDEYGRLFSISSDTTFFLPNDKMPSDEEFDLIDFDDETIFSNNTITVVNSEITELSEKMAIVEHNFNEFGVIADLSFNSDRLKSISEINKTLSIQKSFEEMITPPNQSSDSKSYKTSTIIDLNYYKKITSTGNNDEMVNPEIIV